MKKEIIYIGLGKMGFNMVQNLRDHEWQVHAYNRSFEKAEQAAAFGAIAHETIASACVAMSAPRLIWVMVPHQAVDNVLEELYQHLEAGDTIIEGGNSPYKETMRRAQEAAERDIHFLDAGVSGGPSGARSGACVMVGGDKDTYQKFENLFADISAPEAYGYMGQSGAGHFVKMVHNGIEYGMMQAIAEGFSVMNASQFDLDLTEVARVYNQRSVIESRLVEWLYQAYIERGTALDGIAPSAIGTGEGAWTIEAANELGIPAQVIVDALQAREKSIDNPSYQAQIIMALRNQFGGHNPLGK